MLIFQGVQCTFRKSPLIFMGNGWKHSTLKPNPPAAFAKTAPYNWFFSQQGPAAILGIESQVDSEDEFRVPDFV